MQGSAGQCREVKDRVGQCRAVGHIATLHSCIKQCTELIFKLQCSLLQCLMSCKEVSNLQCLGQFNVAQCSEIRCVVGVVCSGCIVQYVQSMVGAVDSW